MLHPAARNQPSCRLDPKRSKTAGDQIGPFGIGLGQRLRRQLRANQPKSKPATAAQRNLILAVTAKNLGQQSGGLFR